MENILFFNQNHPFFKEYNSYDKSFLKYFIFKNKMNLKIERINLIVSSYKKEVETIKFQNKHNYDLHFRKSIDHFNNYIKPLEKIERRLNKLFFWKLWYLWHFLFESHKTKLNLLIKYKCQFESIFPNYIEECLIKKNTHVNIDLNVPISITEKININNEVKIIDNSTISNELSIPEIINVCLSKTKDEIEVCHEINSEEEQLNLEINIQQMNSQLYLLNKLGLFDLLDEKYPATFNGNIRQKSIFLKNFLPFKLESMNTTLTSILNGDKKNIPKEDEIDKINYIFGLLDLKEERKNTK